MLALVALPWLSGCMSQPLPTKPPTQPTTSVSLEVSAVIVLVNAHRKKVGCQELLWSTAVAAVAQRHSDDMVRRGFFSHTNPDGLTPFQRLEQAGLRYVRAAENIAAGQQTAQAVMSSWLGSPGHRRNIEDCALRQHGIGLTRGTKVLPYGTVSNAWTHNFVVLRP